MEIISKIQKLTLRHIQKFYREEKKIVALTAYDALMAKIADEVGVDIILVGDSLGMTMLGYKNTIPVTLEQSLHHTSAVVRGVKHALVIGDMPFLSFQISSDETVRNAGRFLQEAGADGVKLEGGKIMAPTVLRLVNCGIPVIGHIGILPQRVIAEGGYRVQGKNDEEAAALCEDAKALQDAGAFALILEGLPVNLAKKITQLVTIPTIGIGAGIHCSGQIQVAHDILGMFEDWKPKHAKHYGQLGKKIRSIFSEYTSEVQQQIFPTDDHSFHKL